MSDNNGWPGKPGVPLNPEISGWHWLKTPDGLEVPYEWRAAGESERGHWPDYWVPVHDDNWQAMECTYLGPCLTPDQAAALQARMAELERALKINFHKHVQGASAADVVITRILPYSVSDVELKKLTEGGR
jgi:hypothetical protein